MTVADTLAPDYTIRAQQTEDISRIAEFLVSFDKRVSGYSDFSEEDLRELDRHPRFNPATDAWVVTAHDDIVGYARVWEEDERGVLESFGAVDPDHVRRGIGALLLARIETRARDYGLEKDNPITLLSFVDESDSRGRQLLSNSGFQVVRRLYTMNILLRDAVIVTHTPDGITIRTSTLLEAPMVHSLVEDVFAEHWGHVPMSYDEWSEMVLKRADLDPTLWFIAEEGSEPVGILIANVQGDRGWVSDLGVRSRWRRRGIAQSLLLRSFAEFQTRGLTEAGLGVDAGNETGAVGLYERAGMRPVKVYEAYEKRF
jgi:ribosomal protein S18 acetylase RimI-like enzyme